MRTDCPADANTLYRYIGPNDTVLAANIVLQRSRSVGINPLGPFWCVLRPQTLSAPPSCAL